MPLKRLDRRHAEHFGSADLMSELITSFHYDKTDDRLHVVSTQDVEPYLDENKLRREANTVGKNWKHKWHLPNVLVERFYFEYTAGTYRPMDREFWHWVDRKIMTDSDLALFRTNNPSNPFWVGYK